jgi:hypothetical protein
MKCPHCGTENTSAFVCRGCGYPLAGTEAEKSAFVGRQILHASHAEEAQKSIRTARAILFALGGLNILLALIFASDGIGMILSMFIGAAFAVLGIILPRKPMLFLTLAIALLLLHYLADAVVDPGSLFRGLIWKVFCLSALVIAVRRSERLRQESGYLHPKWTGSNFHQLPVMPRCPRVNTG